MTTALHRPPLARQRGFTLLEVLVALAIAALGLASVAEAFGGSARSMTASRQHQEALSRARSRLDAVAVAPQEAEQSGDDGGGFRYRTLVRAVGTTARRSGRGPAASGQAPAAVLYALTVWVSWGGEARPHTVRLDTERLYAPPSG